MANQNHHQYCHCDKWTKISDLYVEKPKLKFCCVDASVKIWPHILKNYINNEQITEKIITSNKLTIKLSLKTNVYSCLQVTNDTTTITKIYKT